MKDKLSLHVDITDLHKTKALLQSKFKIIESFNIEGVYDQKYDDESCVAIFTNPNNCPVYYDESFLKKYTNLKYIATASTGTVHLDLEFLEKSNIKVFAITKELEVLEKISSTAEHALALSLAAIRFLPLALKSVECGQWNYSSFIGRQVNMLTIGVIGYGRLGKMYSRYMHSLGAEVFVYDPYKIKEIREDGFEYRELKKIFSKCNLISLHCHVNHETKKMINKDLLMLMKSNSILINTARGEIVSEIDLLSCLEKLNIYYYTDVIASEFNGLTNSPLYKSKFYNKRLFITPHMAGMTYDAREIAYTRAAEMLLNGL
jgi:D-3-phosphoglycerate dehydrogenase